MAGLAAQAGPHAAGLRRLASLLLAALAAGFSPQAHASAWKPPAKGREITTLAMGERDGAPIVVRIVDETGVRTEIIKTRAVFSTFEGHWEVPLAGAASLVVEPSYEWWRQGRGKGEAKVAAKIALPQVGPIVSSLQAGPTWTSEPWGECSEGGGEARLLAGAAREGLFVNAEAAMRVQDGGCPESRIDLTAGFKAGPKWMGLGQVFVTENDVGGGSAKVQLSLVRFRQHGRDRPGGWPKGLQFGVRLGEDRDGGIERALVIGWWSTP